MQISSERSRAIWTPRGWAISVLQETGAIRECEDHGWMKSAPIRTPRPGGRRTGDEG